MFAASLVVGRVCYISYGLRIIYELQHIYIYIDLHDIFAWVDKPKHEVLGDQSE